MTIFARQARVEAPLEEVWRFHTAIDGLVSVTPDWMNLRVEGVYDHNGETETEDLDVGSIVRLSIRPFGIGPRQSWTSRIVQREEGPGSALITDVMIDGPFETWEHTHALYADDGATVLRDRIEYEFPVGALGILVDPIALMPLELLFRYRHRRTKELLE